MKITIKAPDTNKKNANQNIRFLRKSFFNVTQERFSIYLGITRNMINNYERGIADPSINVLLSLHAKLHIDITRLLTQQMSFSNYLEFFVPGKIEDIEKISMEVNPKKSQRK